MESVAYELFEAPRIEASPASKYVYVRDGVEFCNWMGDIYANTHRILSFDVETTGLQAVAEKLVLVQIHHRDFPTIVADARYISPKHLIMGLVDIMQDEKWLKIAHNAQFDYGFILHHLKVRTVRMYDTMLAEKLITAGYLFGGNTLADVARKYCGHIMDKSVRMDFPTLGDKDLTEVQLEYAASDVQVLEGIMNLQIPKLKERELMKVAKLEFALIPALSEAHLHGVSVDRERWMEHLAYLEGEEKRRGEALVAELQPYHQMYQSEKYAEQEAVYNTKLAQYQAEKDLRAQRGAEFKKAMIENGKSSGEAQKLLNAWKKDNPPPKKPPAPGDLREEPINLGSSNQLGGALKMYTVPVKQNELGNFSIDKETLKLLSAEFPICQDILDWREVQTILESFGTNVLERASFDGRLHPTFKQYGAVSGRMACAEPNVQQIPGNEIGGELRRCFVAGPGNVLLDLDYSNIELRILADLANARGMIKAFHDGVDLHSVTACKMFGFNYDDMVRVLALEHPEGEDVKKAATYNKHRKIAKTINFGVPYGQSPAGFARHLNLPYMKAKEYMEAYFDANPEVERWLKQNSMYCLRLGYTETLLGRKRFFDVPRMPFNPDDIPDYKRQIGSIKRWSNNHPIQGLSADITKLAIVKLYKALRERGLKSKMIMFVHDEIVIESPVEEAEEVMALASTKMREAGEYFITKVPVEIGTKSGVYWSH